MNLIAQPDLANPAWSLDQYIINLRSLQNDLSKTEINSISLLTFNPPLSHILLNLPPEAPYTEGALGMQDPS